MPPPFGSGGRGTLAGEKEGGRVPIPTRGHTLRYIYFVVGKNGEWYKSLISNIKSRMRSSLVADEI